MSVAPRLELRAITKRYPGKLANDAVSLSVGPGEIHAVLGENGAGKSTLMKIIYGAVEADTGEIRWNGAIVRLASPAAARRLGIGMVYQHFSLFETVTVAQNIAAALEGGLNLPALSARILELGAKYGLPVDPHRLLHHLSVGERQRVEILRCLLLSPKLLILDEPTAVLTPDGVARLFVVLRSLADAGCSILYISHKLEEVRTLCHSATILRGGRVAGSVIPGRIALPELARMMVGAAIPKVRRTAPTAVTTPCLEIRTLSSQPDDAFGIALDEVNLTVHSGEIVGIAGISGNGQRELLSLLTDTRAKKAEMVMLDGRPVGHLDLAGRRASGLAFVPEERLGRGAVPHMTMAENALLTGHRGLVRLGFVSRRKSAALARDIIDRYHVACGGPEALARSLSGGNLQKFIVGREIGLASRALIVSQPTWGVDVAASAYLRQSLLDLAQRGIAILVVSEELDELFDICDRIAVMFRGRLSAARPWAADQIEDVGLLMAGVGAA